MAQNSNPLQPLLAKLPAPLRNKYFIALVLFFAWMLFFDKHDFLTQYQLNQSLNKLEMDREYYTKKMEAAEQERLERELNREKFAREQYYMKRANEDVFIIVDKADEDK